MSEANEVYVFFCCLLCGAASGVVYDFLYAVKQFVKGARTAAGLDVLFFLAFAGIYVFTSVVFSLPAFRFYMFCGCLSGLLLYLKSVHLLLAFFIKRLYNIWKKR